MRWLWWYTNVLYINDAKWITIAILAKWWWIEIRMIWSLCCQQWNTNQSIYLLCSSSSSHFFFCIIYFCCCFIVRFFFFSQFGRHSQCYNCRFCSNKIVFVHWFPLKCVAIWHDLYYIKVSVILANTEPLFLVSPRFWIFFFVFLVCKRKGNNNRKHKKHAQWFFLCGSELNIGICNLKSSEQLSAWFICGCRCCHCMVATFSMLRWASFCLPLSLFLSRA